MFAELWSQYVVQLPRAIVPTILFIVFCQFHVYEGLGVSQRLKGILYSFLTSYLVLFTVQLWVYFGLALLSQQLFGAGSAFLYVLRYIIYVFFIFLFAVLFCYQIKDRNQAEGAERKVPAFGAFVYAQYMVMVYVVLIFADNEWQIHVFTAVVAEIWYLIFKNDFTNMARSYPREIFSIPNICLILQVVVTVMIWFVPGTMYTTGVGTGQDAFFAWMKALAVVLFIFCLIVHKVIYSQIQHSVQELENLNTDQLTGLPNRNYFLRLGEDVLQQASASSETLSLVFINIVNFKHINQNYGSAIGDELLKALAKAIADNFNECRLKARVGDDHFVLILTDDYDLEVTMMKVRNQVLKENGVNSLQLSAGVYTVEPGQTTIAEALEGANVAARHAKSSNTVAVRYFDSELARWDRLSNYVVDNIDRAIHGGMIKVYYQPIVNVFDERINSAEALSRWEDDNYGFMPPDVFIPVLEEQNIVYKIDCYVIEQICKDQRKLMDEGKPVYPVGFNISRKDFFVIDMVEYVEAMVERYNIPRSLIIIEITESALSQNDSYIKEEIERFMNLGYEVWMDDFGSGYSSLNNLGTFHFTGIKLDMVFLRDITPEKVALIKGIIATAQGLGLNVLTEGVETDRQFKILQDAGCNSAQGYRFSRPKPLEQHLADMKEEYFS